MKKFKRMLGFVRGHRLSAVLAPLFMIVEVYCDLRQPYLMSRIVDVGVASGDMARVLRVGLDMLGFAVLGMLGGVGCSWFSNAASQGFAVNLRSSLFRKTLSFASVEVDRLTSSSLITRLTNDVNTLQQLLTMALQMMIRAPLLFLGGIAMAATINLKLTLILVVAIPLILTIIALVIGKGFALFARVQEKLDGTNRIIQENLTAIRVVKAFVRSGHESRRFGEANDELTDTTVRASLVMVLLMPLITMVMNLSVAAVLGFGGPGDVFRGLHDADTFVAHDALDDVPEPLAEQGFVHSRQRGARYGAAHRRPRRDFGRGAGESGRGRIPRRVLFVSRRRQRAGAQGAEL
jgi:ATP-binding cassette, subfamily B, multidrug efflux pump